MPDNKQGYLGLPWGASEADLRAKNFEVYRSLDLDSLRRGYSVTSVTLTEGQIPAMADFSFKDGRLVGVYLRFRVSDFRLMTRRLTYRYGRASLEEPDRLIWRGGRTSILMLRSSITPDMASVHLLEPEEWEALSSYQPSGESES